MKRDQKVFLCIVLTALVVSVSFTAYTMWGESTAWTDTGNISWVSSHKTFDGQWHTAFAITTQNHGVLNFTYPDQQLTYMSTSVPPAGYGPLQYPIGIVRDNFGSYKLVVDP